MGIAYYKNWYKNNSINNIALFFIESYQRTLSMEDIPKTQEYKIVTGISRTDRMDRIEKQIAELKTQVSDLDKRLTTVETLSNCPYFREIIQPESNITNNPAKYDYMPSTENSFFEKLSHFKGF